MPLGLTLVLVVATAIGPLLMCSTARSRQVALFHAQVHRDYFPGVLAALSHLRLATTSIMPGGTRKNKIIGAQ